MKNRKMTKTKPGIATTQKTSRHEGKNNINCVAIMGPKPRPNNANPLCCKPCKVPRREGFAATAVAAKLVGQNAPSEIPIKARIRIKLVSPIAAPEKPEANEKITKEISRILRCPILSERCPEKIEKIPQVIPNAPKIKPTS